VIANLSLRTDRRNPNHHLWLNNGTWFVHYTTHPTQVTKERVRRSLKTKSVKEARRLRDELLPPANGGGVVARQDKLRGVEGGRREFIARRFTSPVRPRSRRVEDDN
jgi:hypothetical protein